MSYLRTTIHTTPFISRYFSVMLVIGVILSCPSLFAQQEPLSFAAMGDGPYDRNEWPIFAEQVVSESKDPRSTFLIHLGDITSGTDVLPEWYYIGVAGLLKISEKPVYVVIGDNEWNDLDDPAIGWQLWRKHFEGFHHNFDDAPSTVSQAAQPDNFAFVQNGVLIIGLNVVGGTVHDKENWTRRHANDMAWVNECLDLFGDDVRAVVVCAQARPSDEEKHDDFFDPFIERITAYNKPALYLHGDGHAYEVKSPWRAPNLVRVQIDSVGKNPPLLVTVTMDPSEPFTFDRRIQQDVTTQPTKQATKPARKRSPKTALP